MPDETPEPPLPALSPMEAHFLSLIKQQLRAQMEQQGRLLWAIILGGFLNLAFVVVLMGGNLAISTGYWNVELEGDGPTTSASPPDAETPLEPAEVVDDSEAVPVETSPPLEGDP